MSNLLEETLVVLYELREGAECEDNARAVEQIDLAINNLEKLRDTGHSEAQMKQLCLQAIGTAIRFLPTVARIIELMRN